VDRPVGLFLGRIVMPLTLQDQIEFFTYGEEIIVCHAGQKIHDHLGKGGFFSVACVYWLQNLSKINFI